MPKTSKASRLEEFNLLRFKAINGRLVTWKTIKRYLKLQQAFSPLGKERVVVSKTFENR